jgi:hypothetical protein
MLKLETHRLWVRHGNNLRLELQDYVNNIITSMSKRIHAVLQADGFRTKH